MSIHTILLDLDGTLTDPKIGITTCIRYGLQQVGRPVKADTDLDWCIGPPLKPSLASLLQSDDDALAQQALEHYRERFGSVGLFENHVYPNVATTLAQLQQQGFHLILATAKPTVYAQRILDHFELSPYFEAIHGSELDGTRTDKGLLIAYILAQHRLSAANCIMVGDRHYDIVGARQNNMPAIAVRYGYGTAEELQLAQTQHYVDAFEELLTVLPRLQTAL